VLARGAGTGAPVSDSAPSAVRTNQRGWVSGGDRKTALPRPARPMPGNEAD